MFYARFETNFNSKPFGPERITWCTAVPKLLVWTQRQGCHRSMVIWYVAVSHVYWTVPCHPYLKVMKEIDEALHQKVQTCLNLLILSILLVGTAHELRFYVYIMNIRSRVQHIWKVTSKHMKQRPSGEERRNSGSDQCLDETGFESGELHCGSSCGLIFPIAKAWSSGSGLGRGMSWCFFAVSLRYSSLDVWWVVNFAISWWLNVQLQHLMSSNEYDMKAWHYQLHLC